MSNDDGYVSVYSAPIFDPKPEPVGASAYTVILQLAQTIEALRAEVAAGRQVVDEARGLRASVDELVVERGKLVACVANKEAERQRLSARLQELVEIVGTESVDQLAGALRVLADRDAEGLAHKQRADEAYERNRTLKAHIAAWLHNQQDLIAEMTRAI